MFINFYLSKIYCYTRFPLDKADLLQKWLNNIKIENWTPNVSSLLCSEHFEQTCFRKKKGNYVTLKDGSIPTIFKIQKFDSLTSGKTCIVMFSKFTFKDAKSC